MFSFGGWSGGGSYARDDLADYREHYPKMPDDPKAWECVEFYRNTHRMNSNEYLLEEFLEKRFGALGYLESAHNFIQVLFPLREKGLNWSAQTLQRHEIATMRSDPVILKRVVKVFELILDFWGFKLESAGDPELLKPRLVRLPKDVAARCNIAKPATASAADDDDSKKDDAGADSNSQQQQQEQKNENDDDGPSNATAAHPVYVGDGSHRLLLQGQYLKDAIAASPLATPANGGARIVRKPKNEECFDNLNTSSHNYLRITRVLKFLGEMGLEHLKVAWLETWERELYGDDVQLYNVADSYERYFIGTIYDDELRKAFEARAKENIGKAKAAKEAAWKTRYGSGGGYSLSGGGIAGGYAYAGGGGAEGTYGGLNAVVINDNSASGANSASASAAGSQQRSEDKKDDGGDASGGGKNEDAAGGAAGAEGAPGQ